MENIILQRKNLLFVFIRTLLSLLAFKYVFINGLSEKCTQFNIN